MPVMRAARLHEIGGQFSIDEVPVPQPATQDVQIKVSTCGIIPNLRNVVTHFPEWYPFLPLPALPAIFGLDAAGTVTAVGSGVSSFKVGDRVYVNPGIGCNDCHHCHAGQPTLCDAYTFMGYFGFGPGSQKVFERYPYAGYAEYMTANAASLVRLPDTVGFKEASRFGYLGTAYSGLLKARLEPSHSLLVMGASGTLGVGAVLLALAMGASKIFAVARDPNALERLQALAPGRVIPVAMQSGTIASQVRSILPEGVDAMLDTLGAKAPAELSVEGMSAIRRGGRIVQIGGVAGPIPIEPHPFMCQQLQYIGSLWFTTAEAQQMVDMMGAGILSLTGLDSHPYPLEQLNQALEDIQTMGNGFTNFHIQHA